MTTTPQRQKVRNITGRPLERCAACVDGWVELAGSETIGGETYTRGWAPCKWCELGVKRYMRATEQTSDRKDPHRRWQPESDFDGTDIIEPGTPGPRFRPTAEWLRQREADGIKRGALMLVAPRSSWPPEWTVTQPETLVGRVGEDETVADKRRQAQLELNRIHQEGSP